MLSLHDPFHSGQESGIAWASYPNAPYHPWDADLENMLAMSRGTEATMRDPSDRVVYALLAKTIFNLRPTVLPEWTFNKADEAQRAEVFRHISELCDTMQQRLSLHIDPRDAATLAMLSCTAAGLIRETYRNMLERFRVVLRDPSKATDPVVDQIVVACSTIHCHSPQLRAILQLFRHLDGLQEIVFGSSDLLMDLQYLQNDAQHVLGLLGGYSS